MGRKPPCGPKEDPRKAKLLSWYPQRDQRIPKIFRARCFQTQPLPGAWVNKTQAHRVQHLPWRTVADQLLQSLILAVSVSSVADQRVSQKLEMHADLMGPARIENRLHQGGSQ